jgi:hypothetical protein
LMEDATIDTMVRSIELKVYAARRSSVTRR